MSTFSEIINWENVFKQSNNFQSSKPFKFAFIDGFFKEDFYEKLFYIMNTFEKDRRSTWKKIFDEDLYSVDSRRDSRVWRWFCLLAYA